ncbi:MAG TPA: RNase A-like domain-containing protein [Kofleriaceae bacterium]
MRQKSILLQVRDQLNRSTLLLSASALALLTVPAHAQALTKLDRPLQVITLESQEAAGGHTIARHVGKDAAFIKRRVIDQQLDAASTFRDKATAQKVCMAALDAHRAEINAIAFARQSGPANVAFTYDAYRDIGSYLAESNVQDTKKRMKKNKALKTSAHLVTAVVHFNWSVGGRPPHSFFLLTCYPNP